MIRKVSAKGAVSTVAGSGAMGYNDDCGAKAVFHRPRGICYNPKTHELYVADQGNGMIRAIDLKNGMHLVFMLVLRLEVLMLCPGFAAIRFCVHCLWVGYPILR